MLTYWIPTADDCLLNGTNNFMSFVLKRNTHFCQAWKTSTIPCLNRKARNIIFLIKAVILSWCVKLLFSLYPSLRSIHPDYHINLCQLNKLQVHSSYSEDMYLILVFFPNTRPSGSQQANLCCISYTLRTHLRS
jgi:hypothetical protein